jgi:plasmid stabilization system protein ParE
LPDAAKDLARLREFIRKKNPIAAATAAKRIKDAAQILINNADVGVPVIVDDGDSIEITWFRDLIIPFGSGNYILRYRKEIGSSGEPIVVVTQLWHNKEERL